MIGSTSRTGRTESAVCDLSGVEWTLRAETNAPSRSSATDPSAWLFYLQFSMASLKARPSAAAPAARETSRARSVRGAYPSRGPKFSLGAKVISSPLASTLTHRATRASELHDFNPATLRRGFRKPFQSVGWATPLLDAARAASTASPSSLSEQPTERRM